MMMEKRVCEEVDDEEEKWVKHYSSLHHILLVGDGDFSFSLCLANSFGSASNIVASSLDSFDRVTRKYRNAKSNIEKLKHLGATVLHGVDAIKMKLHADLRMRKFDRIIFNFPHAGFHGKEDSSSLIQMHRKVVSGFFRSASGMLRAEGEVHVNHKTTAPFCHWDITGLALNSSLVLVDYDDFHITDYPGYSNKRGDGRRCDEPFPLGQCGTFKFIFSPHAAKRNPNPPASHCYGRSAAQRPPPPILQPQQLSAPSHCAAILKPFENECYQFFGGYFNHVLATFGKLEHDIQASVRQGITHAYRKYMAEKGGSSCSSFNGYINLLEQLLNLSKMRSEWLKNNLFYLHQQPLM
ncbi:unnamed protein product [Cuscuta epithymum]|uniref:25S rRNA (uridine-N(3))-methyltransferase BMT5-like domain-containing protein n=1 Tax=Cuscuta epithymum TaxID=186058 RepID=A0AAV0FHY3_9ASTE|nr:unnamed protein product [Cuscuta epithymum]